MSVRQIYNVFDLGPGDGGKGGVVHKLSCHHNAHTIIKVGGAQGSHGVTAGRFKFAFSQWGCGTFEDVNTHITSRMVISPIGLLNEAYALHCLGVINPFDLLTVDELAICATPYHGIVSRLKEISLGDNPRGTIGSGVGQTYRDSHTNPELTIIAKDLKGSNLKQKLSNVRDYQIQVVDELINDKEFLPEDLDIVRDELSLLRDLGFLDHCISRFKSVGQLAAIVDHDYLNSHILAKDGVIVVESSHGVLTDNVFGFVPHVSALRTLPSFTLTMLQQFTGEIHNIGVHRAYTVRHGAGPMPTADASMNDRLLPGSQKEENRYQGKIRVGPLDMVLLQYAIKACGCQIDSLAITWFDQIVKEGVWRLCDKYSHNNNGYFNSDGSIKFHGHDEPSIQSHSQRLCEELFKATPIISEIKIPSSRNAQHELCHDELFARFCIPVNLVSFGPSKQDKSMRKL